MDKTEFELFEEWAIAKGHYPVTQAISRFRMMQASRKGDKNDPPVMTASAMALIDKLHEKEGGLDNAS